MKDVFVYVIATRDGNEIKAPVKIGVSSNPRSRLDALRTASPFDLVLARELRFPNREIALDMEQCFHATQKRHRRRGEWFDMPPADAIAILELHTIWVIDLFTTLSEEEKTIAHQMVGLTIP